MSRPRLSRNSQSTVTLQQVAELMDARNFCFGTGHFVDGGKYHLSELGSHCEFIRLRREHFHNDVLCSLGAVNQRSSTFGVENNCPPSAWLVISAAAKLRSRKCVLAQRTFWFYSSNKFPGPCRVTSHQSPVDAACLSFGLCLVGQPIPLSPNTNTPGTSVGVSAPSAPPVLAGSMAAALVCSSCFWLHATARDVGWTASTRYASVFHTGGRGSGRGSPTPW